MAPHLRRARRAARLVTAGLCTAGFTAGLAPAAQAGPPAATLPAAASRSCPPAAAALSFSDALDKVDVDGVRVGGLSSLADDRQRRAWASTVDNRATDPSRIWFFRSLASPRIVTSLVLRRPDGTPYTGATADNEGLAVLPDGRYVVSSETEPSIRIFGRDGVEQVSLPVPARFAVTGTTPQGEATANATLEGLTLSPDGRRLVAAMEGPLSGDVARTGGDATWHRFLVYRQSRNGWTLRKQIAYRTEPGQRVAEVAAVGDSDLLVLEAAFAPATGNAAQLYLVRDYGRARDVTGIADLSAADDSVAEDKRLLADVVACPTLGATSKQPQTNPLLDNYEGMAVTGRVAWRSNRLVDISLISDDNFGATQTTRVLNLAVRVSHR